MSARPGSCARASPLIHCIVGVALLAGAAGLAAQAPRVLSGPDGATNIRMTRAMALGDEDRATVGPGFTIARLADGRLALSTAARPAEILVFSRTGQFLGAHGRAGQGPGEFLRIRHLRYANGMLHVFDGRSRRWTRLSARDLSVVGTTPFPGDPFDFLPIGDTLVVSSASIATTERIGLPLHYVGGQGSLLHSFGADAGAAFRVDLGAMGYRHLSAATAPGNVWAAHFHSYRLERFGEAGRPVQVWQREAAWFQSGMSLPMPSPTQRPVPFVRNIRLDPGTGLLWVLVAVADEQWGRGLARTSHPEGSGWEIVDWNGYLDTVIEVVDVVAGRIVASRRVDEFLWTLIDGPAAVGYTEEGGVRPKIVVYDLATEAARDIRPELLATGSALERGDLAGAHRVLREAAIDFSLNDARRALQVFGCDGVVVASFPLSATAFSAFSRLVAPSWPPPTTTHHSWRCHVPRPHHRRRTGHAPARSRRRRWAGHCAQRARPGTHHRGVALDLLHRLQHLRQRRPGPRHE